MQTKPKEDGVSKGSSDETGTQPPTVQSLAEKMTPPPSPLAPPSPPATPEPPELPRVPPPSPSFGAKASFLSKPCIPNYSLCYRAASAPAPTGGNRNGECDKVSSISKISAHSGKKILTFVMIAICEVNLPVWPFSKWLCQFMLRMLLSSEQREVLDEL